MILIPSVLVRMAADALDNFRTGESDTCKENLASTGGRCYGQENVYVEMIWVFPLLHCEH